MQCNIFGEFFSFQTWGESHGKAIGCLVDGIPPNIPITEADIQKFLDQRKPAQSKFTTQRKEPDIVNILSGIFEGKTTGTPISMLINNADQRSRDYSKISNIFRPGHADYTYFKKYGIRDYRGGGRSSARETAMRVAAGGIARKILGESITIRGVMIQVGTKNFNRNNWNWEETGNNPFFCPDAETAKDWEKYINMIRKDGSSIAAVIEIVAEGVPAGWGTPVYDKLDSDLAKAMMSINAVKAVEIGAGFKAAELRGEENADEIRIGDDRKPEFLSNNAGGILGSISSEQPIVVRFAVKPASSILTPRKSIDVEGNEVNNKTKGRHDPGVGIRAVPVGEAMMACVLADHFLRHRAQYG